MSKYDKASLVMIPSAYKAEKLYSVLPENGNGDFTHDRNTTATRVNKDGLIETVAADVPRLDYPLIDGIVQDCPALLLEPSRTNSLTYSNLFTNAGWAKAGAGTGSAPTVTGDYAISPDGSQNASRLQLDKGSGTTTGDYSYMYKTVASVSTGSISIWMKSNDSNTYQVALRVLNYTVCDVTPEWQRFELNNQSSTNVIQIMLRGTYGTSDDADILIYGAQVEEGSYSTSYIPTSGSVVTRNADVCNSAGTSAEFNDSEGVMYAEIAGLDDDVTNRWFSLSDGTANNNVVIRISNENTIISRIFSNSSAVGSAIIDSSTDIKIYFKVAIVYNSTSHSLFVNGFKIGTQLVDSSFSSGTLDKVNFDNGVGNSDFYGKTKELAVFKEALTDSELESLTSWDSFNEMATSQLYTIR